MNTPATQSAVVYDAETGRPLRVIVPDYTEQLSDPTIIGPNESFILIDKIDMANMSQEEIFAYIQSAAELVNAQRAG